MAELDPLSALSWLVDAGADEAIGQEPVNRLTARPVPKPTDFLQPAKPAVAPTPVRRAPTLAQQAKAPAPIIEGDDIGAAQDIAARANTLAELRTALETFEGCLLKRIATNTVFADGVEGAPVLCIGEAPGYDEDRIGKPFVGRAGQLLDKMLAPIGLSRETNTYIINVLPWRPPDNRNPDPVEVAKCIPFLRRHIELADPKLIVLLGAVAVRNVMGKQEGIMLTRGKWLDYNVNGHMVPVMPTLHPAYLLRRAAEKKLAWRDLQMIQDRISSLGLLDSSAKGA
jgi:DNA polymerase